MSPTYLLFCNVIHKIILPLLYFQSYDKLSIHSTLTGFQLNILIGDLFKKPNPDASLAHCVSRDLKLGKGIAKLFREKFSRIQELANQKADIGEIAILKVGPKFVYNLVTKAKYSDKPTYESLRKSLVAMKEHAVKHQVKNIAMPKIGCGLDMLEWNAVRTLIKNVFLDTPIKIDVYILESEKQSGHQKVSATTISSNSSVPKSSGSHSKYPMLDIAEGNLTPIVPDAPPGNGNSNVDEVLRYKNLPDLFVGDKIFLQKGMEQMETLMRYIISVSSETMHFLKP